jgi:hypothetical protein
MEDGGIVVDPDGSVFNPDGTPYQFGASGFSLSSIPMWAWYALAGVVIVGVLFRGR